MEWWSGGVMKLAAPLLQVSITPSHHFPSCRWAADERILFRTSFACLMKSPLPVFATTAIVCVLAGCGGEAETYAKSHPELSAAQRKIMLTGKIPDGAAVAGMTRDQVRKAMGRDPSTFDKVGNQDVWIFSHHKMILHGYEPVAGPSDYALDKHGTGDTNSSESQSALPDILVKTAVYFNGNLADHAQTTEEKQ